VNNSFTVLLQKWYHLHKRRLPWRDISDPYLIWLSEIILQQTRVNQGLPYYNKFIEAYPTLNDLANSTENEVLKLWQGLGYYSRGRNLLKCAKEIVLNHNGVFPTTLKEIKKLPGIGDYTASAILSFAYNQPHAVLDGNVYRVLSRYFGIHTPINSSKAHSEFKTVAASLLDTKNADIHNQAIMEFGALHCTPKNPDCTTCVFHDSCEANRLNIVDQLPMKNKARPKRSRFFNYIVFVNQNKCLIQQRGKNDIWQGLHEFPLIESSEKCSSVELVQQINDTFNTSILDVLSSVTYKHILTHQTIYADFWVVPTSSFNFNRNSNTFEVDLQDVGVDYPIPVLLNKFLESTLMKEICQ
jgi:A/G-specific adenine glycosylase